VARTSGIEATQAATAGRVDLQVLMMTTTRLDLLPPRSSEGKCRTAGQEPQGSFPGVFVSFHCVFDERWEQQLQGTYRR
jgi:hypothetical protein